MDTALSILKKETAPRLQPPSSKTNTLTMGSPGKKRSAPEPKSPSKRTRYEHGRTPNHRPNALGEPPPSPLKESNTGLPTVGKGSPRRASGRENKTMDTMDIDTFHTSPSPRETQHLRSAEPFDIKAHQAYQDLAQAHPRYNTRLSCAVFMSACQQPSLRHHALDNPLDYFQSLEAQMTSDAFTSLTTLFPQFAKNKKLRRHWDTTLESLPSFDYIHWAYRNPSQSFHSQALTEIIAPMRERRLITVGTLEGEVGFYKQRATDALESLNAQVAGVTGLRDEILPFGQAFLALDKQLQKDVFKRVKRATNKQGSPTHSHQLIVFGEGRVYDLFVSGDSDRQVANAATRLIRNYGGNPPASMRQLRF